MVLPCRAPLRASHGAGRLATGAHAQATVHLLVHAPLHTTICHLAASTDALEAARQHPTSWRMQLCDPMFNEARPCAAPHPAPSCTAPPRRSVLDLHQLEVRALERGGLRGTCCRKGAFLLCFWAPEAPVVPHTTQQVSPPSHSRRPPSTSASSSRVSSVSFFSSAALLQGAAPKQRHSADERLGSGWGWLAGPASRLLEQPRISASELNGRSKAASPGLVAMVAAQVRSLSLDDSCLRGAGSGLCSPAAVAADQRKVLGQPSLGMSSSSGSSSSFSDLFSLAPEEDLPAGGTRAKLSPLSGSHATRRASMDVGTQWTCGHSCLLPWCAVLDNLLLGCLLVHCLSLLPTAAIPGAAGTRWDAVRRGAGCCSNPQLALVVLLHYVAQANGLAGESTGRAQLRQLLSLLAAAAGVLLMLLAWSAALLRLCRQQLAA